MQTTKTLTLRELQTLHENFPLKQTCEDEIWQIVLNPNAINSTGYIAGSAALKCLSNLMGQSSKWTAGDIDCFIPKMKRNYRQQIQELNLDMVCRKEENIGEVLLDFDIPCCRVAYDPANLNFYVSYQTLMALQVGYYYLPEYLKSIDSLLQKLSITRPKKIKAWTHLFERFQTRIQKYQERGFNPIYIQHDSLNIPAINQFDRMCGYFSNISNEGYLSGYMTNRPKSKVTKGLIDCN